MFYQSRIFKNATRRFQKIIRGNPDKKIAMYGVGIHTDNLLREADLNGIDLMGFFDKSEEKQKSRFRDLPVFSPRRIPELRPDILIISSHAFQSDISKEISEKYLPKAPSIRLELLYTASELAPRGILSFLLRSKIDSEPLETQTVVTNFLRECGYKKADGSRFVARECPNYEALGCFIFGIAAWRNKDLNKAKKSFSDALRLNPGLRQAEAFSKLLEKVEEIPVVLEEAAIKHPNSILLELARKCNTDCEMCGIRNTPFSDRENDFMSVDDFHSFRPLVKKTPSIFLCGRGENLLNPKFRELIRTLRSWTNNDISLYSNGLLLQRENIKCLIENRVKHLLVSFEGETKIGHGGGRESYMSRVIQNLKKMDEMKKKAGVKNPCLIIQFTISTENLKQLPEVIKTAVKVGAEKLYVGPMFPSSRDLLAYSIFNDLPKIKKAVLESIEYGESLGVEVILNLFESDLSDSQRECIFPLKDKYLYFYLGGDVHLCCNNLVLPVTACNVEVDDLVNIFPTLYFRKLFMDKDYPFYPIQCGNCNHFRTSFKNFVPFEVDPHAQDVMITNFVNGVRLREAGKCSEAMERFDFIVQQEWSNYYELIAEAYFQIGEMALLGRDFAKAEIKLKKCVKFNFSHSLAFEYLHLLEVRMNRKCQGSSPLKIQS